VGRIPVNSDPCNLPPNSVCSFPPCIKKWNRIKCYCDERRVYSKGFEPKNWFKVPLIYWFCIEILTFYLFKVFSHIFTNLNAKSMDGKSFESIFGFKTLWTYPVPYCDIREVQDVCILKHPLILYFGKVKKINHKLNTKIKQSGTIILSYCTKIHHILSHLDENKSMKRLSPETSCPNW
jgi:hypothetical protein